MSTDVAKYITTCSICQMINISRHQPYGDLQPLPISERSWWEISLDWIVGLSSCLTSHSGEVDSILVVVDCFSKMARFITVQSDMKASEFAEYFH